MIPIDPEDEDFEPLTQEDIDWNASNNDFERDEALEHWLQGEYPG